MKRTFSTVLSELRRLRGLSQRSAAADLGISQALLSHYENGAREPGLAFVCRACDYYGVTADYILGRSESPDGLGSAMDGIRTLASELREIAQKLENFPEGQDR